MDILLKFFKDFLSYKLSQFISGRKNYPAWKVKNYSLKNATIKNENLAEELEKACKEKGGILTYSEFIEIDQFGTYGYHATHNDHGMTEVGKRWPDALITLCKKNNISNIVELGPGTGDIAIEIQKIARQKQTKIYWSGIEKNMKLCEIIQTRFEKNNYTPFLKTISQKLSDVSIPKRCIFFLSYSLDSIPPEIVVNTNPKRAAPNAIIGITVKNGILQEQILSKKELKKKKISFHDGILKYKELSFNLSSWNLYPMQRAYIPFQSITTFKKCIEKATLDSIFVVIDEFRQSPLPWETGHLCLPRDLHTFTRDVTNLEKSYQDAGNTLYYFPMFFGTFYKLLPYLGFTSIKFDIEQKLANEISGKKWQSLKGNYTTNASIAANRKPIQKKTIPLEFPMTKLV